MQANEALGCYNTSLMMMAIHYHCCCWNLWIIGSGNWQKLICNTSHDWLLMNIYSDKFRWHVFDGHFLQQGGQMSSVFLLVNDALILVSYWLMTDLMSVQSLCLHNYWQISTHLSLSQDRHLVQTDSGHLATASVEISALGNVHKHRTLWRNMFIVLNMILEYIQAV